MPAIVIKNLPSPLHRRLKTMAAAHRRSMNQQALVLLEEGINRTEAQVPPLPPPVKGRFPMTQEFVNRAKHQGRA